MSAGPEIRDSTHADRPALESLYPAAFPDEDLLPLVRRLLDDVSVTISRVAILGDRVAGHILFTRCREPASGTDAMLLGPLAVAPDWQGRGIGSALIADGFRRLAETGVHRVYVLGDPGYYEKFAFAAETVVEPPYPLPAEWEGAWQSLSLGKPNRPPVAGRLSVPPPWRQPALWTQGPE